MSGYPEDLKKQADELKKQQQDELKKKADSYQTDAQGAQRDKQSIEERSKVDQGKIDQAQKELESWTKATEQAPAEMEAINQALQEGQAQFDSATQDLDIDDYASVIDFKKEITYKMWRYTPESYAAVLLGDSYCDIIGGPNTSVLVSEDYGVIVKGDISLLDCQSIQFSGLWTFNDQMISTIPSTIMSPQSILDFHMPGIDIALKMKSDLAALAALMVVA